jgi:hypothetical protein
MTIPYYRHLTIVNSRKHLRCGGFQSDHVLQDNNFDTQSAHSTWATGSMYARGIQEAAGHVEGLKYIYSSVSRKWHDFPGFAPASLSARKRTLLVTSDEGSLSLTKLRVHDKQ